MIIVGRVATCMGLNCPVWMTAGALACELPRVANECSTFHITCIEM